MVCGRPGRQALYPLDYMRVHMNTLIVLVPIRMCTTSGPYAYQASSIIASALQSCSVGNGPNTDKVICSMYMYILSKKYSRSLSSSNNVLSMAHEWCKFSTGST